VRESLQIICRKERGKRPEISQVGKARSLYGVFNLGASRNRVTLPDVCAYLFWSVTSRGNSTTKGVNGNHTQRKVMINQSVIQGYNAERMRGYEVEALGVKLENRTYTSNGGIEAQAFENHRKRLVGII
jgi:hypothetical protein